MTDRRFRSIAPLLGAALLALGALPARAQVVLTTAVPFLQIEPDSRAAGMGMSGVAVADNAYAVFWNPAGLAGQEGTELSFTHAPWLPALGADLSYEYLVAKHNLGDLGTVGAHLTYFNLGTQVATDELGNDLGEFSSFELSTGLSYGYQLSENLSLGTGARLIYSNLTSGRAVDGASTSAGVSFGTDFGVLYRGPELGLGKSTRPTFGASLANAGPGISYTEGSEFSDAIPTTLRFGTAINTQLDDFNRVSVSVDLNKVVVSRDSLGNYDPFYKALFSSWGSRVVNTQGGESCDERAADPDLTDCSTLGALQQLTLGTGLEYWYNDLLALRTGYFYEDPANGNRQFLTFGAGIRYSLVGVDLSYIYALEENSPVADQLRFSLLLNIPR
jgi:long-subunit fatty acid transport protein